jgi:hypothetical protein
MTAITSRCNAICALAGLTGTTAWSFALASDANRRKDRLFAVLGQSPGERKLYPRPQLVGKVELKDNQGNRMSSELAAWDLLADIHVRFLFHTSGGYFIADLEEFQEVKINSLPYALKLATENLRRECGAPRVSQVVKGVSRVTGVAPGLNTGYFFDYEFWLEQLNRQPSGQGLAIGAPTREDLLFCSADDFEAIDRLRSESKRYYSDATAATRVSTAVLRLMNDGLSLIHMPE